MARTADLEFERCGAEIVSCMQVSAPKQQSHSLMTSISYLDVTVAVVPVQ